VPALTTKEKERPGKGIGGGGEKKKAAREQRPETLTAEAQGKLSIFPIQGGLSALQGGITR